MVKWLWDFLFPTSSFKDLEDDVAEKIDEEAEKLQNSVLIRLLTKNYHDPA